MPDHENPCNQNQETMQFQFPVRFDFLGASKAFMFRACVFVFVSMGLVLRTKKTLVVKAGAFNFHC